MAKKNTPTEVVEPVKVRRAPKFAPFMLTGGLFGALIGGLLWILLASNAKGNPSVGGYVFLFLVAVGIAGGTFLAVILDWWSHQSAKQANATKIEK